jgi:hypothetical protein
LCTAVRRAMLEFRRWDESAQTLVNVDSLIKNMRSPAVMSVVIVVMAKNDTKSMLSELGERN